MTVRKRKTQGLPFSSFVEDRPDNGAGKRDKESGNVFVIIFIAVILFAALLYSFSRGAQQGTGNLTARQAEIAAMDVLSYGQQVERAVNRIARRGISENDISFENNFVSGYENANCTTARCKIFQSGGGALSWQAPAPNVNGGQSWIFTGANRLQGFPADDSGADLVAILPELGENICRGINEKLNLSHPLTDSDYFLLTPFAGTYVDTALLSGASGESAACVQSTTSSPGHSQAGEFYFYQLLHQR